MIFGIPSVYFWLILLVVCVVAEAITIQLISLWFAVGSLGALVSASFGVPILWQFAVFAVLSLILLLLLRPMMRKLFQPKRDRTNADRIVGEEAVVTETIDNRAGTGQIRLLSQTWTARAVDGEVVIPEGSTVYVDSIVGVKAMVVQTQHEVGGCRI